MSGFAGAYLALLERSARVLGDVRVRALHLPPPRDANPDNKGEFCAIELDDGSLGLAFVLLGDVLDHLHAGGDPLRLRDRSALELARGFQAGSATERVLGFAAANALTRRLFDRAGYVPGASADSIGELDPRPGERIGMIGFFRPLVARIVDVGAELTVVELNPELVGQQDGYRVTLDAGELAGCGKVMSTATLLLNDTLDTMLGHCRQARRFAMVGPSAGCLPDPLFARGVTLLGGSWVIEPAGFIDALRRGEPHSAFSRKFAIPATGYPGFEVLLARAQD